ncbi:MAG: hypothetical protein Q7V01_01145 [Vicinamibacterales bacterium]|nr:hypothetical protein [Vicinamibacterales bacterium]
MRITLSMLVFAIGALSLAGALPEAAPQHAQATPQAGPPPVVSTSETCIACHTGITGPTGENLSFVTSWQTSLMANSARDPYWQAGVRREVTDHPSARAAIEDECSACHMPMARYLAHHGGGHGEVFTNLPAGMSMAPHATLAADGVACVVCHQITPEGLGTKASFNARFKLAAPTPGAVPKIFGPFDVDKGRTRLMRSSTGFEPAKATHLAESDMCGSCHTLFTTSLGPNGEALGEFPEQMPYLEWQHSEYRTTKSCQACHMPVVQEPVPVTSVLGQPREGVSRHTFQGGNFFMQRMLARYRTELGVQAWPEDLDAAARRTLEHLGTETAGLSIATTRLAGNRLAAEVTVSNLAGHKLPTAYPSRRAWLHVIVRDAQGAAIFESGAARPDGSIVGNDNDEDGARYEPHHLEVTSPGQVQIYEAIMGDPQGAVTTGLLRAVTYLKDNRILPKGFDKATASKDIAVRGRAASDSDFGAGVDRVRYIVDVSQATGPFTVEATLNYQTIAYRWARNLAEYKAPEPERFVRYYDAMAAGATARLARTSVQAQ